LGVQDEQQGSFIFYQTKCLLANAVIIKDMFHPLIPAPHIKPKIQWNEPQSKPWTLFRCPAETSGIFDKLRGMNPNLLSRRLVGHS
jgi:hypothetical protein